MIAVVLSYMNSAINPFIYGFSVTSFKQAFFEMLGFHLVSSTGNTGKALVANQNNSGSSKKSNSATNNTKNSWKTSKQILKSSSGSTIDTQNNNSNSKSVQMQDLSNYNSLQNGERLYSDPEIMSKINFKKTTINTEINVISEQPENLPNDDELQFSPISTVESQVQLLKTPKTTQSSPVLSTKTPKTNKSSKPKLVKNISNFINFKNKMVMNQSNVKMENVERSRGSTTSKNETLYTEITNSQANHEF